MLIIIIIILIFGLIYKYRKWGNYLSPSLELYAQSIQQTLEDDFDEEQFGPFESQVYHSRVVSMLGREAKIKFGLLTMSVANRTIVRKYLLEICKSQNMRTVDISRYLDAAVNFSFVPSRFEIEAKQMMSASSVVEAFERYEDRLETRALGKVRGFTAT